MKFFTADLHFGHKNILSYGRGDMFDEIAEHDAAIIRNWNDVVDNGDEVYIIGDVSFWPVEKTLKILRTLRGQKFLVYGNHDKGLRKKAESSSLFQWCGDIKNVRIDFGMDRRRAVLCHFPLRSWEGMHRGAWHLHGHCHGSLVDPGWSKLMDVGLDCHPEFRPFSQQEIWDELNDREFIPVDHHRSERND